MKAVALAIGVVLALFLSIVVVAVAGFTAALSSPSSCSTTTALTGPVEVVAATIRTLESGGNYTAQAPGSSASGAYQFIDSSWAGYGGYPRAYLAPPTIQDAKAVEWINRIVGANTGNVAVVPVAWYIGHVPADGSPEWDQVPAAYAGNVLTPREYQARWLDTYRQLLGTTGGADPTAASCTTPTGTPTVLGDQALPVEAHWFSDHPAWLTAPHHCCTPASDIPVPVGTPVFAAASGTLIRISEPGGCGWGYQLTTADGFQIIYCHLSAPTAAAGPVRAGDLLGASGGAKDAPGAGNSTGAHLHLGVRRGPTNFCPQAALQSWTSGRTIDFATLPTSGCTA